MTKHHDQHALLCTCNFNIIAPETGAFVGWCEAVFGARPKSKSSVRVYVLEEVKSVLNNIPYLNF